MALILEFKARQSPARTGAPIKKAGNGLLLFFTGIRYERMPQPEMPSGKRRGMASRRASHSRQKTLEAHA